MGRLRERFRAIFRQRCPRCLKGKVFAGLVRMNENCPEYGYHFEREQGYFLGAMYASYFLAVPAVGLLTWAINEWLVPSWTLEKAIFLAAPPFILVSPLIFRYSRVIWMHFDRVVDSSLESERYVAPARPRPELPPGH
jgi:uncharacterized protein (DUF983 family)